MAAPAPTRDPDTGRAVRLLGIETEYGFAVLGPDGARLDPGAGTKALMQAARALVPNLPCGGACDVFTANGSRVYIDAGLHPEVGTPECSTPEEAVRFARAGDLLLARAARAVARTWPGGGVEAVLWKANVDHRTGATWGSHESYLHVAPQPALARQLLTHLVTRIVYTGAGGFDNRAPGLRFVVSPRARHLEHAISADSTRERGIFHTRDEPLAAGGYRRLHVLAGESLWSETADYLRTGTTALLVAQVDAGREPQAGLDLAAPLEALATLTHDVTGRATVRTAGAGRSSAVQIQRRLLESVEADLGAEHLPAWASAVCARWRAVLERLEASPASLVGVLDWPTKLAVLRRQCEAEGLAWTFSAASDGAGRGPAPPGTDRSAPCAARLLETDMRFNRLDGRGIFAALDAAGALAHRVVTPEAIERALREPPALGRARIRAAWVARLARRGDAASCDWQEITDHQRGRRLVLGDPFQSTGARWSAVPGRRPGARDDPRLRPVHDALAAGAPRAALRHMHAPLAATRSFPDALDDQCLSVLEGVIPCVPVPILRRGAAGAGRVLEALLERAARGSSRQPEERVGTLLYRFHEARGAYHRAAQVIARLIARAEAHGDDHELALLVNNRGYEHLLAGEWATAAPLLERAAGLLEAVNDHRELPSVRANLLECRLRPLPPERWTPLLPELETLNRRLVEHHDWRARKTLMLLARHARARGRRAVAAEWARRAVAAAEGIPTQLRAWDRAFLDTIHDRRSRSRRA